MCHRSGGRRVTTSRDHIQPSFVSSRSSKTTRREVFWTTFRRYDSPSRFPSSEEKSVHHLNAKARGTRKETRIRYVGPDHPPPRFVAIRSPAVSPRQIERRARSQITLAALPIARGLFHRIAWRFRWARLPRIGAVRDRRGNPRSGPGCLGARDPSGDRRRGEHDHRREEERGSPEVHPRCETEGLREHPPEEDRPKDAREAQDARIRSLQLALFRGGHAAAHQALQGGLGEADEREHGDSQEEYPPERREAVDEEPRHSPEEPSVQGPSFPDPLDDALHEDPLDRDVAHTDDGEREADLDLVPIVSRAGVDHEDARQDLEREETEERGRREPEEPAVGAEEGEGSDRVRPPPRELLAN